MPSPYSPSFLHWAKASLSGRHSGWPRRACAHCGGFAPAAPRRAWALVSGPISGLPLPRPVPVIGMRGFYPLIYLMGPGPILGRPEGLSARGRSRHPRIWGISPSFPGLSPARGQVDRVLLSRAPGYLEETSRYPRLAWLSPTPIAVGSGRINRI